MNGTFSRGKVLRKTFSDGARSAEGRPAAVSRGSIVAIMEAVPEALVEHKVARLVHHIGSYIGKSEDVRTVTKLLRIAQQLREGRLGRQDLEVEGCEEVNAGLRSLAELGGGDWRGAFLGGTRGLYLCLGEVLLNHVGPNWLALLPAEDREDLYYGYFDAAPKVQLLRFLVGQTRREGPHHGDALDREAAAIAKASAVAVLDRVFVAGAGASTLFSELLSAGSTERDAKEAAALVSTLPDLAQLRRDLAARELVSKALGKVCEVSASAAESRDGRPFAFLAGIVKGMCRRGFALAVVLAARDLHRASRGGAGAYALRAAWDGAMARIRDLYALEHLIHAVIALEAPEAADLASVLFQGGLRSSADVRTALLDRVLVKRTLPRRAVRAAFNLLGRGEGEATVEEAAYRAAQSWSREESPALLTLGHQASLGCAIIEGLARTTRERLESEHPTVPLLLAGVSARLSSANPSVRTHGMAIASALSSVLDPAKPIDFGRPGPELVGALLGDLARATCAKDEEEDEGEREGQEGGELGCYAGAGAAAASGSHLRDIGAAVCYGTPRDSADCEVASISGTSSAESDSDDESLESLEPYDLSDGDEEEVSRLPATLGGLVKALRRPQDHEVFERVLRHCEGLISRADAGLGAHVTDLARALLYADAPEEFMRGGGGGGEDGGGGGGAGGAGPSPMDCKRSGIVALLVKSPSTCARVLCDDFYSVHLGTGQRLLILDAMQEGAARLSGGGEAREVGGGGELGSRPPSSDLESQKTRVFAPVSLSRSANPRQPSASPNGFAPVAHAFMLPLLSRFDHKGEGLDMVGRDFALLGRLLRASAAFVDLARPSHQAVELAFVLHEFVVCTRVLGHRDAHVRKSAVQAVRSVLGAVPSFLIGPCEEGSRGGLSYEGCHDALYELARADEDEECRVLAAWALSELEKSYNKVLPKIEVLS